MRIISTLFFLIALAGSATLAWIGGHWAVAELERRTEAQLAGVLAQSYPWAEISASGLEVKLWGHAPSEADRINARALLHKQIDSARVVDAVQVTPKVRLAQPDFVLEVLRTDNRLTLIGLVPQDEGRAQILDLIGDPDGVVISDMLESADYPSPRGWADALRLASKAARILPQARISATPGEVQVHGTLPSDEARRDAEIELGELDRGDAKLSLKLTAPPRVVAPYTFAAEKTAEGWTVSACHANDADEAERFQTALMTVGHSGQTCTVALGRPDPAWADAAEAALQALAELDGGTVALRDLSVTLTGADGTDREAFDTASEALKTSLPAQFKLTANPPRAPELNSETAPKMSHRIC